MAEPVNLRIMTDGKSRKKGATLLKSRRFLSQITIGGKYVRLGAFETAEEAHQVYVKAANDACEEVAKAR